MGGRNANSGLGKNIAYKSYGVDFSNPDEFMGAIKGGETETWINGLQEGEKKDIGIYSGSYYEEINAAMRKGDKNNKYYQQGKRINEAIQSYELKENIVVYRGDSGGLLGLHDVQTGDLEANIKALVGKTFQSKNLVSADVQAVPSFAQGRRIKYNIKVPAGKGRGAYIRPLSYHKDSEREFLMSTKNKYKVVGYKLGHGKWIVDLEVS